MKYKELICVLCLFFCCYPAESCITQKVEVIKGEIYYIGLFSINITENQPDIRRSEAFGKHARLTFNAYYSNKSTSAFSFAYTAYEMCDNKLFMKEVILSLLLDEEFNLQESSVSGKSSRIATIFTNINTRLTKTLLALFSFEDVSIVSQLLEYQIFKNNKDLVPYYIPSKIDPSATRVINIAKIYSSNHAVIVCLTNEKPFKQICYGVIEMLSNEKHSCFSVIKVYPKSK